MLRQVWNARPTWRAAIQSTVRGLLLPWWARATLGLGALGATLATIATFDSDGLIALVFALAFGGAWLAERAVIAVRVRTRY